MKRRQPTREHWRSPSFEFERLETTDEQIQDPRHDSVYRTYPPGAFGLISLAVSFNRQASQADPVPQ